MTGPPECGIPDVGPDDARFVKIGAVEDTECQSAYDHRDWQKEVLKRCDSKFLDHTYLRPFPKYATPVEWRALRRGANALFSTLRQIGAVLCPFNYHSRTNQNFVKDLQLNADSQLCCTESKLHSFQASQWAAQAGPEVGSMLSGAQSNLDPTKLKSSWATNMYRESSKPCNRRVLQSSKPGVVEACRRDRGKKLQKLLDPDTGVCKDMTSAFRKVTDQCPFKDFLKDTKKDSKKILKFIADLKDLVRREKLKNCAACSKIRSSSQREKCKYARCHLWKLRNCFPIVAREAISILTKVPMVEYQMPCMCSMSLGPLIDARYRIVIDGASKPAENSNNEIFIPRQRESPGGMRWQISKKYGDETVCQYAITMSYYQCSALSNTFAGDIGKVQRCSCAAQQSRGFAAEMTYDKYGNGLVTPKGGKGPQMKGHQCKKTFVYVENLMRSYFAFMNSMAADNSMGHCLKGC